MTTNPAPQINNLLNEEQKTRAAHWFRQLQKQLCKCLEELEDECPIGNEPPGRFHYTPWQRGTDDEDAGGGLMGVMSGRLVEKAGIHSSTVYGTLSEEFRERILGTEASPEFWASGVSVIIHPRNPHVPAVHLNTRLVVTNRTWFGGGMDLTPLLDDYRHDAHPDTCAFHNTLKKICDRHDTSYPKLKQACDDYFYLPHRGEARGMGGIFYDYINSGDWEEDFAFSRDIGLGFLEAWPPIARQRMTQPWTEDEREQQLIRRGRYVEFNLLYDRGTTFGLKTGGNVSAILSSLPPVVKWP
ncbi:MAG: oxygen-dependent coproporphyrinogen oxidase [Parvularculales bacterium]